MKMDGKRSTDCSSKAKIAAKAEARATASMIIKECGDANLSPKSQQSQKGRQPSEHLLALKLRMEKEAAKFATNYDLIFLRRLREEGHQVHTMQEWEINLLYKHEQEKHFKEVEKSKKPCIRKKGPREILHPDIDFKKKRDSKQMFDSTEFRNKISSQLKGKRPKTAVSRSYNRQKSRMSTDMEGDNVQILSNEEKIMTTIDESPPQDNRFLREIFSASHGLKIVEQQPETLEAMME